MDNIIRGPIPLDDLNENEYEEGQEEEECGEEDVESQIVHDVETGDDIKLPKGNRGKTWRVKEDEPLCVEWMGVSQDAIIITQQNSNSHWTRIHRDFLERTAYPPLNVPPRRKSNEIEKQWGSIREAVNKFHGCWDQVKARNKSGTNQVDVVRC